MPRILQIAQLGHPVLRKDAEEVSDIQDPTVQSLIDDMFATVFDIGGIGLAAPQVYQSLRLFVMGSRPVPRFPHAPTMEPTAMINPQIISSSDERAEMWEGCLSIPGLRGLVPRPKTIHVQYTTRHGEPIETEFTDFLALLFQHEYDHLQSTVFLDRVEDRNMIMMEKEYQKQILTT